MNIKGKKERDECLKRQCDIEIDKINAQLRKV